MKEEGRKVGKKEREAKGDLENNNRKRIKRLGKEKEREKSRGR